MNIRIFLLSFFVFGIGLLPASAQESIGFDPNNAHYLWPTEASRYLSSTFGETRSAHFHAALDIKTWGRRGYEVYATRDGIVDRIAIGPRGYGKVIYLKHSDGSYSIYAHLLSFNEQLQQLADSVRIEEGYKFEIERFLSTKNIRVKQGEVIGYSGASGIGPPHLHYELRTPSHRPFNPLLTNLSVSDNIAPQIQGLSVEPLSPESSVEGQNKIFTKPARLDNGTYKFGTVKTSGSVGLGIDVFDQANRVHNSYAVYELQLSINGQNLFSSKVDSFSYYETDQMFIDRVYPILNNSDKGYQRLYIVDGNTLPFYNTNKQQGVLNLPPGKHEATIKAKDFFGNTSTAKLTLQVENTEQGSQSRFFQKQPTEALQKINSPQHWHWFTNWVTLSNEQFQNVTVAHSDGAIFSNHENGIAIDLRRQHQLFMNIPGTGSVKFYRIPPHKTTFISSSDLKSSARFPKQTFYDTLSVGMAVQYSGTDSVSVNMIPNAFPIKGAYKFYTPRDSALTDTSAYSFYHWEYDDEEWDLIPTTFTKHYIISEAQSLGRFSLLKDETSPEVENPRIEQRPDDKWIVLIDATDNLSGIDYKTAEIWVDGTRGIAEFEPEDDRFVYYHPDFKPTREMEIKIFVSDKMGNETDRTFTLTSADAKK